MTGASSPEAPSAETVPAESLARAMRFGFWAIVIDLGFSLLFQLFNWFAFSLPTETFGRWLRISWGIGALESVGVVSVFAFMSWRLASVSTGAPGRLASTAAALFVARGCLTVFTTVAGMAELRLDPTLSSLSTALGYALFYGSWALLFLALGRKAKAWGFRLPLVLLGAALFCSIASAAGDLYWQSQWDLPDSERPGLWLAYTRTGLSYASTLALAAVWFISRGRLLRAREAASPELQRVSSPEWRAASSGLALYRGALLARIAVMLLGIGLLLLVSRSGEQEPTLVVLRMVTVATLACGIASLAGLFGYTRVPESSGARDSARTALWIGVTGGLFDGWAVALVFRLSSTSVSAAFDYMDQAPWVEAGAQSAGLVALMFLLSSFHRAATALGVAELASRASSLGWLLGIAGFASMGIKLIATTQRSASGVLVLAVPAVIALLIGAVSFVLLVGALVRAMHEGPPKQEEAASPGA